MIGRLFIYYCLLLSLGERKLICRWVVPSLGWQKVWIEFGFGNFNPNSIPNRGIIINMLDLFGFIMNFCDFHHGKLPSSKIVRSVRASVVLHIKSGTRLKIFVCVCILTFIFSGASFLHCLLALCRLVLFDY